MCFISIDNIPNKSALFQIRLVDFISQYSFINSGSVYQGSELKLMPMSMPVYTTIMFAPEYTWIDDEEVSVCIRFMMWYQATGHIKKHNVRFLNSKDCFTIFSIVVELLKVTFSFLTECVDQCSGQ